MYKNDRRALGTAVSTVIVSKVRLYDIIFCGILSAAITRATPLRSSPNVGCSFSMGTKTNIFINRADIINNVIKVRKDGS